MLKRQKQDAKTVQVSAKVSSETYRRLKAKAKTEDRTVAYTVRRLILDALGLDYKAAR